MKRLQAIVFDLDDTLYPESAFVFSGMRAVAAWAEAELGIPSWRGYRQLRRLFEQGVRRSTFNHWLEDHALEPADWVPAMVQVYRQHQPQIVAYPEVRELLGQLRAEYRLGIVTDGYLEVQRRKLAALDLAHYFQAVVYSDELGRDAWKPSSRPFELVLERLSVASAEAVYVADNPSKDFRGARAAGLGTIRVRHPDGLYSRLEPPSADDAPETEIPSLRHLESHLVNVYQQTCRGGRIAG